MKYELGLSEIHGNGIIASELYPKGELIGSWCSKTRSGVGRKLNHEWYESDLIGRYCNHSLTPNTYYEIINENVLLYTKTEILINDEITVDYTWAYKITGFKNNLIE